MSRRPTHTVIGAGIALSLLGWGAGRVGEITLDTLRPNAQAAHKTALPSLSVHLSIEVRP
ncbi:hypothetical protein [Sphingomonas sp. 1185]|uniref:hypothetical protein n=1 Tax=Sphingomonas sp. 1185 TaxID=3156411 RepID=UPI003391F1AC